MTNAMRSDFYLAKQAECLELEGYIEFNGRLDIIQLPGAGEYKMLFKTNQ
jgi:hypothetical protein